MCMWVGSQKESGCGTEDKWVLEKGDIYLRTIRGIQGTRKSQGQGTQCKLSFYPPLLTAPS